MNIRSMLLAVLLAFSFGAVAQESAQKPADTPAATPPTKSEAAKADAKAPAKEAEGKVESKPTKDSAGTPQRFIPTEQVRSDFDVSFPVDI